jgi:hypothetical protein
LLIRSQLTSVRPFLGAPGPGGKAASNVFPPCARVALARESARERETRRGARSNSRASEMRTEVEYHTTMTARARNNYPFGLPSSNIRERENGSCSCKCNGNLQGTQHSPFGLPIPISERENGSCSCKCNGSLQGTQHSPFGLPSSNIRERENGSCSCKCNGSLQGTQHSQAAGISPCRFCRGDL